MTKIRENSLRDAVITMAGIVLLLAFARYASTIVVPFLLALFIAIVASTPMHWLRRKGLAPGFAITLVLMAVIFLQLLIAVLLGSSIHEFNQALPDYQKQISALVDKASTLLAANGIHISKAGITNALDPGAVMRFANSLVAGIAQVISNTVLIIFMVLFMLIDFVNLAGKFDKMGEKNNESLLKELSHIVKSTNQYITIKTMTSIGTGFLIWLGLTLVGLDFAVLLGFMAFALNYVPTIGSFLAAVPGILLALIQLDPSTALVVAGIYLAVNTIISYAVEPKVMGTRLGLSILAVFMSLVFWGWLFGPVGMLLSVPLTIVVQNVAMVHPQTRWFGILLSPGPDPQK